MFEEYKVHVNKHGAYVSVDDERCWEAIKNNEYINENEWTGSK